MRFLYLASAALLGLSAVPALAQVPDSTAASSPRWTPASNIGATNTKSEVAPTLPTAALGDNAGTPDYLRAARAALVAGHTGLAQQSLEMAETRALDRSVAQGQGGTPSDSHVVAQIRDALQALGDGNRPHAIELIDLALAG